MRNIFNINYIMAAVERVVNWKDRLLLNVVVSIVEAAVVLLISSLYLIVLSINYGLATPDIRFLDAFAVAVETTLRPTEMITYVTGILSSTTAYFVVRLFVLRTHIKIVTMILLFTAILFWLATPLFISGLDQPPVNQPLAIGIAKLVGVGAFGIWLYSLFCQRWIFEREITIDGDRRGNEIARRLGDANV